MEWIKDHTPMFMDVAKDVKGREAIEYGYETENEYKDHLVRVVFERDEQRLLDFLLLELMKTFDMYIGNDEMTTLENCNVPRAIEISKSLKVVEFVACLKQATNFFIRFDKI